MIELAHNGTLMAKRNFSLVTIPCLLCLGILGVVLFVNNRKYGNPLPGLQAAIPVLLFITFIGLLIGFWLRNSRRVCLAPQGLRIWHRGQWQPYQWPQVVEVKLTGKAPLHFLVFTWQAEAVYLRFNDGWDTYLQVDFYKNMPQIRQGLMAHAPHAVGVTICNPVQTTATNDAIAADQGLYRCLKGKTWLSLYAWILYGWMVFCGWVVIQVPQTLWQVKWLLFLLLGCSAALVLVNIKYAHYFVVCSYALVIKNSWLKGKKYNYPLPQIREVVIEQLPRGEVAMRIITKTFTEKRFGAAGMKHHQWMTLQEALMELGVPVRNELSN